MIKYLWGSKGVTCTLVFGTNYSLIDRALMKELQKSQKPWAAGEGIDLLSQELAADETMPQCWLNVSSISTTFAQHCSNIFASWKQPHSSATCHLRHTHWTFRGRRLWLKAGPTSYQLWDNVLATGHNLMRSRESTLDDYRSTGPDFSSLSLDYMWRHDHQVKWSTSGC